MPFNYHMQKTIQNLMDLSERTDDVHALSFEFATLTPRA